jgi:uncharacterized membrane protein YdbT with pleckstrin-like domain
VATEERVVWTGRPSWKGRLSILGPGVALALAALVLLLILGVDVAVVLPIVLIIALVTVVVGLLETLRWKYTFTNRRIVVRHGLVSVEEQTARLARVQDLTLRQTLLGRILGVGSLEVDTAGSEGGAIELKWLDAPAEVREKLEAAVQAEQESGPSL